MPRARAASGTGTNFSNGNGKQFGSARLNYTYQEVEGGIAEHVADHQKICVVLGGNIIEGDIREASDPEIGSARFTLTVNAQTVEVGGCQLRADRRLLGEWMRRRLSRANFIPGDIFPSHNQRHELRTGGAPYRETDGPALKAAPVYTPDAVQEVG